MKIHPFFVAGGIGSILIFAPPMAALILVYVSPAVFVAALWIAARWLGIMLPILFVTGILYALAREDSAVRERRQDIATKAALTAFGVGLVGTASEIIARIIPDILVSLKILGWTYVPLNVALLPVLCIVCFGFSILGAGFGALGAWFACAFRNRKPAKSASPV